MGLDLKFLYLRQSLAPAFLFMDWGLIFLHLLRPNLTFLLLKPVLHFLLLLGVDLNFHLS